jgi:large subunit ribosomal protein L4
MDLKLIDAQGRTATTVTAADATFGRAFNEPLVHQLVVAYEANNRRGTRAQKARGDISGSHRKPWRQKGTGRARAGFAGSPLWRGGAKIFPSSPNENFSHKVNRKMYRAGMASILSQLAREDRLRVVEDFAVDAPQTKLLAGKVKALGLGEVLLITDEIDRNLYLSARNLPGILVLEARHTNPVLLVRSRNVVLTRKALAQIEEMFA